MDNTSAKKRMQLNVYQDDLYKNNARNTMRSQAKMAMEDTIGQASAMTGGYANSYAQTVGQQEYARVLDSMNNTDDAPDIDSELYQNMLNDYLEPENESDIPDGILAQMQKYTTEQGQSEYLASLVNQGTIDLDQSIDILERYGVKDFVNRTWEMIDDGGGNFLGLGIDRNAKVSDGTKTYTLAELRRLLDRKTDMTRKEATEWIKELEEDLGIRRRKE